MRILRGTNQSPPKTERYGLIERLRWAWSFADARVIVWPRCSWVRVLKRAAPRHAPDLVFSARGRYARAWFARGRSLESRAKRGVPSQRHRVCRGDERFRRGRGERRHLRAPCATRHEIHF